MIKAGYEHVGIRLKEERRHAGLTLAELAKSVGVSASYISQLENGKIVPSLKILDKICTRLSLHLSTLFSEDKVKTAKSCHLFRREGQIEVPITDKRKLRVLLPKNKRPLDPVHLTIHPGDNHDNFSTHKGIEFGYVARGEVVFVSNGNSDLLCREGDSLIYDAMTPHCFQNRGNTVVELLLVGMPNQTLADSLG
jgi:Predicted transcriptional regulators